MSESTHEGQTAKVLGSRGGPARARRARWSLRLMLLGLSLVLTTAMAELALRVVGLTPPRPFTYVGEKENRGSDNFVADEVTGWRMRPSRAFTWETDGRKVRYHADADGRRVDPEAPPPRVEKRLFVAGDSFLWGTGVTAAESIGARVAEGLGGWSVTNLAMPGHGVDQIWLSVRDYALPERPDLVIVGVFPEDLDRSRTAYRVKEGFAKPHFGLVDGELVRRTVADRPGVLYRWLERGSHLFTAGRRALEGMGRRHAVGEWWHLNAAILTQLVADCREAGVPLVILYVPPKEWTPFPMLGRHLEELGAAFLDPVADHPRRPEGLYFEIDSHLNAKGHRAFADWLVAFIEGGEV